MLCLLNFHVLIGLSTRPKRSMLTLCGSVMTQWFMTWVLTLCKHRKPDRFPKAQCYFSSVLLKKEKKHGQANVWEDEKKFCSKFVSITAECQSRLGSSTTCKILLPRIFNRLATVNNGSFDNIHEGHKRLRAQTSRQPIKISKDFFHEKLLFGSNSAWF